MYTVQLEYSPVNYDMSLGTVNQRRKLNSGAVGIIFDTPLTKKAPIYLDYGLKVKYTGNKFGVEESRLHKQYNYVDLSIPLSVLFHTGIANTPLAFAGFLGLDGNFHVLGNEFTTHEGGASKETNFLKQEGYNIFTLDWHIGCRIYFDKYFFGIGYQGAITPFYKNKYREEKFSGLTITLGVTF